jgi:hypothetical protein
MNTKKRKRVDMTPKKNVKLGQDMNTMGPAPKEVIENTPPTIESAAAVLKPVMDAAAKISTSRLIAYAAFEQDGERYEEGDEFIPRKTWKRNLAAEEFRSVEKKRPNIPAGIVFSVPGPILNKGKKDEEQTTLTVILPLKEA